MKKKFLEFPALMCFIFLGLCFMMPCNAGAEDKIPRSKAVAGAIAVDSSEVKVTVVKVTDRPSKAFFSIGDNITVKVENLKSLLDEVKNDEAKIFLYLNGRPLKGNTPVSMCKSKNELQFDLRVVPESKDVWNSLLSKHRKGVLLVSLSVGTANGEIYPTDIENDKRIKILAVSKNECYSFALGLGSLLVVFWVLALKSTIIRDSGPKPPTGDFTYSLALTQMAFWFFIILSSYLYILIVNGEAAALSESSLALMGISSATGLAARVVDEHKPGAGQRTALASEGFLKDILTDVDGITLHRFQIAVWTFVMGIIYCVKVYNTLAMPEIDGSMLALMGISSGTYIGFKFPEKHV